MNARGEMIKVSSSVNEGVVAAGVRGRTADIIIGAGERIIARDYTWEHI